MARGKAAASANHQPTYQEVEFRVIPPHGANGERSLNYVCSGPPNYKRVIELLYSHALTPWQTEADVLRAFIDLGCHVYGKAVGGTVIPGILHRLDMMNRLVEEARQLNDFAESIDALDRQAQRMIDGGMRESAVGLVWKYREEAKRLGDAILKRKLVADINQRFAHLLKGAQGRRDHEVPVRLTDVDTDASNGGYEGHEVEVEGEVEGEQE